MGQGMIIVHTNLSSHRKIWEIEQNIEQKDAQIAEATKRADEQQEKYS